jgi:hypothetical protein
MIAVYVSQLHAAALDRDRALVEAFGSEATVVSPHAAPGTTPVPWIQLADSEVETWREWVRVNRPSLVVVDGAGRLARAVRGLGATVAVVAQVDGEVDSEIGAAYSEVDVILAPWAPGSSPAWPARWHERTLHLGAMGWQAVRALERRTALGDASARHRNCVVLTGTASGPGPRERRAMMVGTPSWTCTYAPDHGLHQDGPVWDALWRCSVAVCAPTSTNLAALAVLRKPAVLVVGGRSHGQAFLAEVVRGNAPVVVRDTWPEVDEWRVLLDRACALDPDGWRPWSPEIGVSALRALAAGRLPASPGRHAQV